MVLGIFKMIATSGFVTALERSPDPLAGLRGPTSKGREKGKGKKGRGGKEGTAPPFANSWICSLKTFLFQTAYCSYSQWRRLHCARGRGTRSPTFTNGAGHGGTVSRTANKKLTKLYWPLRKRSPKRLIVLLDPKSGGARPKNFFGALRRIGAPPTFKFVPAPLAIAPRSHY